MKHTFMLLAFVLFSMLASSQQKVEVEVGEKNMSKGSQMAISVMIPEAKIKDAEPIWKKYINNRKIGERLGNFATQVGNIFKNSENQTGRDRLKVEKNGDELYIRSVEVGKISSHSMDVYARLTELPEGCMFSSFFQYTDSVFINETNVDKERIESLKSFIRDFGLEVYRSVVDDQIKEAKKEVSKQEGILKDIESDSKKENKAIARYETDIQEAKSEIALSEADNVRMDENITTKKIAFEALIKKTPEYDAAKKELKDLEKVKSKNFNNIKSQNSKIKSKEMDIKSSNEKINQNDLQAKKQQLVISDKQKIVDQLVEKGNAIR